MVRPRLGGMAVGRRDGSVLARGDMISEDRELALGRPSVGEKRAPALENWQRENRLTHQCSGLFIAQGMNDTRVSRLHGAL